MQAAGGDADLGAEAKLTAIGILGAGIVHANGTVNFAQIFTSGTLFLGDDGIGMVRTVAVDVGNRFLNAAHRFHRDHLIQILHAPVVIIGRFDAFISRLRFLIAAHLDILAVQCFDDFV